MDGCSGLNCGKCSHCGGACFICTCVFREVLSMQMCRHRNTDEMVSKICNKDYCGCCHMHRGTGGVATNAGEISKVKVDVEANQKDIADHKSSIFFR